LTDTELIRKLDLFDGLNPRTIQRIAELCIVREFAADEYLIRQGESGLGLYFITSGRVKVEVERHVEVAGEGIKLVKVLLNELGEGGVVGEFSIIDDKARSANVICLEDTRCLLLTRDSFSKLLKKHPEIALQMLKSLVGRIRSTNERITESGARSARAVAATAPPRAVAPPPANSSSPLNGIGAATERITDMIPSPGDMVKMVPTPQDVLNMMPRPEDMVKMYSSTKDRVQNMVVGMFGTMYVVKAMTRFSMAMVGCPVSVSADGNSPEVVEAVIDGIKVVVFPAGCDQRIRIEAYGDGELSATVFRPGQDGRSRQVEAIRWEGPVRRNEAFELQVPAGNSGSRKAQRKERRPCRLVTLPEVPCEAGSAGERWAIQQAWLRDGVPSGVVVRSEGAPRKRLPLAECLPEDFLKASG
jgi:CRP-like cAMP-binding protein